MTIRCPKLACEVVHLYADQKQNLHFERKLKTIYLCSFIIDNGLIGGCGKNFNLLQTAKRQMASEWWLSKSQRMPYGI